MSVPCVAVERERGEAVRERLADADILDGDHEIAVDGDTIYIPVADPEAVPADLATAIVERDAAERDRPQTPAAILGYEPSLERLGDIVIVDEDDDERAREIADAVMASDVPCETVLNRASPIEGELRVRRWDVLAGNGTETVHREYGHEFLLDVAEVYFSPRLATERHRVIEQVDPDEAVIDMFAGVGPYAVPMAARGAEVVACDLNERAVEYLRENAERNGVADRVTAIAGDVRGIADAYADTADRRYESPALRRRVPRNRRPAGGRRLRHSLLRHPTRGRPVRSRAARHRGRRGRRVRRGRRDRACRQILRPARVQRLSGCAADPSMTSVYSHPTPATGRR